MNLSALASFTRRAPIVALLGTALTIGATQVASAQLTPPSSNPAQPILKNVLAFKSQPDECIQNPNPANPPSSQVSPFVTVGSTGNIFPEAPPCPSGSQPKVNTSYAWGMTQTGSHVWIGTAVSGYCLTAAGLQPVNAQQALYGAAGFGNPKEFYMWASSVYQNRLYFGTLDWSFIDAESAYVGANPGLTADQYHQALDQQASSGGFGGDLWRIDNPNSPAKAESLNGLGNYLSYGIRNMVADSCNLYVGMANAMNLRTSGTPQGGMEFRVLTGTPCTVPH